MKFVTARSLKAQLALLALSAILPALLGLGGLIWANFSDAREAREHELIATARTVSAAVDQHMAAMASSAEAMATSDAVIAKDWSAARARFSLLQRDDDAWLAVTDRHGRSLLNTSLAESRPAPDVLPRPSDVAAAVQTGEIQFSNLFVGSRTGRHVVAVTAAVPNSEDELAATIKIAPTGLLRAMAKPQLPTGSFVTILDGADRVIARSENLDRFVGVFATDDLRAELNRVPEGVMGSVSLEGDRTVVAYTQSTLTGWTALVVVPRQSFEGPLYLNLAWVAVVIAALLVLGVLLARGYANVIANELKQLEDDAAAVGRGVIVEERSGRIANFDTVQTALRTASLELRSRQERQLLMINELNHRVKNTLATVQSLAVQTFRDGDRTLAAKFDSRLAALATAHDLLTQTTWRSVDIREVVSETTTQPYPRIKGSGPSAQLQPQAALALCMCLHEFTTNSLKYGALTAAEGRVYVSWSLSKDLRSLNFVWREEGGPHVQPPARTGFGTRLIDRLVKHELGGAIERDFAPSGLVAKCTFALDLATRWSSDFD